MFILINLGMEKSKMLIPLGWECTIIAFRIVLLLELEVVEGGLGPLAAGQLFSP